MAGRNFPKKTLASNSYNYADIQEKVNTDDGEGGHTEAWANIANGTNIPMSILSINAKIKAELRTYNVKATHYIKIRSNVPITELSRIKYGNRIFEKLTVEDVAERGVEQFITAVETRP